MKPAEEPFIPFEFADAAYRYGHAQIRDTYVVRDGATAVPLFPDLLGFRPVPAARVLDWSYVFGPAHSLIELPLEITGELPVQEYRSLAVRDLSGTTSSKKLRSAFRVSGSDPSGGASWSFGMAELLAFAQSVRI